jgi:adenylate kinase family enzyme
VLLGPPAAGKGTQAQLLKARYGFLIPSVGAILREQNRGIIHTVDGNRPIEAVFADISAELEAAA